MTDKEDLADHVTLRDHEYDGIQEYDQKLPGWWLFTFYIAIAWFIVAWFANYQLPFTYTTDEDALAGQLALIEMRKNEELKTMLATLTDESVQEMSQDPTHVAAGKAIFETKCVACHGSDLSAKINGMQLPGVALNDAEWLYGGKPLEIMNTITNGSPDVTKGMIAWSSQLSPCEVAQTAAFILSNQPE